MPTQQRKQYQWLSHVLDQATPVYGNNPGLQLSQKKSLACGDSCNQMEITYLPLHLGTHVDAPLHFVPQGTTIDEISINDWIFTQVYVFFIETPPAAHIIKPQELPINNVNHEAEILLIKSGFETYREQAIFWQKNPGLAPELANYLLEHFPKLRAVGMDFISVTSYPHKLIGKQAHQAFLSNGILLIEDMHLAEISPETHFNSVIVAPLRIKGTDGTPCTIIAEIVDG